MDLGRIRAGNAKPLLWMLLVSWALPFSCQEREDLPWVSVDPIQCLGNSWEQDWLARHNNDFSQYPHDEAGRFRIYREFFEKQGMTIHSIEVTFPYNAVCLACGCPRGDRISCLIDEAGLPTMLEWGFRVEG